MSEPSQPAASEMRVAVAGAGGRMGRALVRAVAAQEGMRLVAALDRPEAEWQGEDAGRLAGIGETGVRIAADPATAVSECDAILDFTAPQATVAHAELAALAGIVHVIGTTGLSASDEAALRKAAAGARIVRSGNMSLGVNLLAGLVRRASAALGPDFDVEILEMHHRHKVDAPSGTALMLGEAASAGRGISLDEAAVRVRDGHTGPRPRGAIGFASLRGGSVVGDHMAILAGEGERIELVHRAEDRSIFARGAVKAALWAHDKAPGLYGMADVLGLD